VLGARAVFGSRLPLSRVEKRSFRRVRLRCGIGWGFLNDSQRLLEDSQGFRRIAQKERRYRSGRLQDRFSA